MIHYSPEILKLLRNTPLFRGITEAEIEAMLDCLQARSVRYAKNDFIFRQGSTVTSLGIVVTGSIHIIEEDYWGNRNILSNVKAGQLFAESYACIQDESLRVSVIAIEDSSVLLLEIQRVLTSCSSACAFHARLIQNLLMVLAQKNVFVTEKLGFLAKRSTKDKVMAYLSAESQKKGSMQFDIPYNRQDLSDFLAVDRSALSKELGKLRDEGIIDFQKNHFRLL